MPECVRRSVLQGIGHIIALLVAQAFADRNDDRMLFRHFFTHILQKTVYKEGSLAKINQIGRRISVQSAKRRGSRQPACIPAHDFHNRDGGLRIYVTVAGNFGHRCRNIFRCRAKAGAMVCFHQVIINRFRCADDFDIINTHAFAEACQLMHGVHRIIPTDINEITDIIFTENPQNLIIFKGTFLPIGQLHAAGAKRRGRCLAKQLQGFGVCQCLCQVNQLIRQDTHNTVFRTINFTNILIGHCFFHNACQGRIDGSRRPAGLGNQKIFHSNQPFLSLKKGHLKFISQQFFSNFLTGKPKKENHAPKK